MKKILNKTLLAVALLASFTSYAANESNFRFVVKDGGVSEASLRNSTNKFKTINVSASSLDEARAKLQNLGQYTSIEIDVPIIMPEPVIQSNSYVNSASDEDEKPYFNDPYFDKQTYWNAPSDGKLGVSDIRGAYDVILPKIKPIIGIIDGGFWKHPDVEYLNGYSFVDMPDAGEIPGKDFLIKGDSIADRNACSYSHGTAITGIIAAKQNNEIGIAGIVNANVIAAKALSCDGGFMSAVSKSILWLSGDDVDSAETIEKPVDVINISLRGESECPENLQKAIDFALKKDILIVAASGNDTDEASNFSPANCDGVISVAAIDETGGIANFSNYGDDIDISSMGVNVTTIGSDPDKAYMLNGTSVSGPIISGILGLGKAANPEITKTASDFHLLTSSSEFGPDCNEDICGAGVASAKAFIESMNKQDSQLLSYIAPALNNTEFCDKELYISDDEEQKKRLCALNEVVFSANGDEKEKITYEVFRIDLQTVPIDDSSVNGSSIDEDAPAKKYTIDDTDPNFSMIITDNRSLVSTFNMNRYDYAFRICDTQDNCNSDTLFNLTNKTDDKPDFCPLSEPDPEP